MKKRLICLLLALCTLLQLLTGCAAGGKDSVTQGEMLTEICDVFGMYSYSSQIPYIDSVPADDPYFGAVQACVEWNVIPAEMDYDVGKKVTRGALALAVVNAAELAEEGASDEEKLAVAAGHQLVAAKANGKIREKTVVSGEEVTAAILAAQALWAGKTYETPVEKIVLQEGVKDYGVEGTAGSVVTDYRTEDNRVYVPISSGIDIQPGDGYVLGDNGAGVTAGVAAEVRTEGDCYVITNQEFDDDMAELLAVVGELKVQGTYEPDLLNCGTILDGNGNPMQLTYETDTEAGTLASAGAGAYASRLSSASGGSSGDRTAAAPRELGSVKGSFKFKTSGVDVSGTIGKDKIDFSLKVPVGKGGTSTTSVSISGLRPTVDLDIGWKGVKNASARLDYTTKISEKLEWKKEGALKGEFFYSEGEALLGLQGELKNAQGKGAEKTIVVAAIPLVSLGIADLQIIIKGKLSVSGSVQISVELAGCMGAQYKNGSLRYFKDTSTDVDVNLKAKIELTAGITLGVTALGKEVVGVSAEGGAGASFAVILNVLDEKGHLIGTQTANGISTDLADEITNVPIIGYAADIVAAAELAGGFCNETWSMDEKVRLHLDPCVEIRVYKILKMGLSSDCLLAKWVGGKAKAEFEIWGESVPAAELRKLHIDDIHFSLSDGLSIYVGKECAKKFTPWDAQEQEEPVEESPQVSESPVKESPEHLVIDFSSYILTLNAGQSAQVAVSRMPNGYSESDLQWSSSDPSVASVDGNGTVTALREGAAVITASLKDRPDVKASCSVSVLSLGVSTGV